MFLLVENIYLDGLNTNCSDVKLAKIRNKKIGFIFQNYNLFSKFNVIENVELPLITLVISCKMHREKCVKTINKGWFRISYKA